MSSQPFNSRDAGQCQSTLVGTRGTRIVLAQTQPSDVTLS